MPMNIKVPGGGQVTRLAPFNDATANHKKNSDKCNAAGTPRKAACLGCIKNVGAADPTKEPGRGSNTRLETFS